MELETAGRAPQTAQREGDLDALAARLHPLCAAVGPDGEVFTKAADLYSHRSSALRVRSLVEESSDVQEGTSTGSVEGSGDLVQQVLVGGAWEGRAQVLIGLDDDVTEYRVLALDDPQRIVIDVR